MITKSSAMLSPGRGSWSQLSILISQVIADDSHRAVKRFGIGLIKVLRH